MRDQCRPPPHSHLLAGIRPTNSGKEVALAVRGQADRHPQQCACPPRTHLGPPEDRALRLRCQTWSAATTHQISGTWGRHHRALGRKKTVRQAARGWGQGRPHLLTPHLRQAHCLPLCCWPQGSWPVRFCDRPSKYLGPMWEPLSSARSHPEPLPREPSMPWALAATCQSQPAVEPAHPGSRWLSPLQKDCHSCCTGGQGLLGDRGTARCGGHRNVRWSLLGSSRTAGMSRCPAVGSGTPV